MVLGQKAVQVTAEGAGARGIPRASKQAGGRIPSKHFGLIVSDLGARVPAKMLFSNSSHEAYSKPYDTTNFERCSHLMVSWQECFW